MASAQSQLDLSRHKEAQKRRKCTFASNHTTSTLFWLAQPAHSRLFFVPVYMCQVLSSDDGKGPKLNALAKHYLPTSSADDCSIYDLKSGLPIDVFVLYLILLLQ